MHARGFTAGQKNCGKSGLGYWASGPRGRRGLWAAGRGPAFSKTPEKYVLLIGFLLGDLFRIPMTKFSLMTGCNIV